MLSYSIHIDIKIMFSNFPLLCPSFAAWFPVHTMYTYTYSAYTEGNGSVGKCVCMCVFARCVLLM